MSEKINKLLPCPFCGSEKLSRTSRVVGHGESAEVIRCKCGASAEGYFEKAEDIWNRRYNAHTKL